MPMWTPPLSPAPRVIRFRPKRSLLARSVDALGPHAGEWLWWLRGFSILLLAVCALLASVLLFAGCAEVPGQYRYTGPPREAPWIQTFLALQEPSRGISPAQPPRAAPYLDRVASGIAWVHNPLPYAVQVHGLRCRGFRAYYPREVCVGAKSTQPIAIEATELERYTELCAFTGWTVKSTKCLDE